MPEYHLNQAPLVVLDTSVLFSYIHNAKRQFAIRDAIKSGDLTAVLCDFTLGELTEVALRFHDRATVDGFVTEICKNALTILDPPARFTLLSDANDSIFFNLAIESKANYLVTYDKAHILPIRETVHQQHAELTRLSPNLKIFQPIEMARELAVLRVRGN
jgi:putative PIN family toxin of toxin-antitoxin system